MMYEWKWGLALLLIMSVSSVLAQENEAEQAYQRNLHKQEKKNPITSPIKNSASQPDTSISRPKVSQRPLPKFDLPEYVITGMASVDIPKLDKISLDDGINALRVIKDSPEKNRRDRETMELEVKQRYNDSRITSNRYSGFLQAGIGTYFTPHVELQFGQSLSDFYYMLGGTYNLTKGFSRNTDQSGGMLTITGGTSLASNMPILRNAALQSTVGYESKSFRFYGFTTPDLQRTINDFQLDIGMENQTVNRFPYKAGISLRSMAIADSSASLNEILLDLNLLTTLSIQSFPVQAKLNILFATGGLGFMDLSGGFQYSWYSGIYFEGSLHFYWAKGMVGQNLARLRPHLMAGYQISVPHRVYISYKPMCIPMSIASNMQENQFLSATSTVRHADITNAGELGIESDWNEAIRSRVSFSVQSIQDLGLFSDSSRQGVWTLAYGGQTTITTICAEMFAKLESNDYFASNIKVRSTKDSFLGSRIPYVPALEAGCNVRHKFGSATSAGIDVKYVGERKADLFGKAEVSGYAVVGVSGEYVPSDLLKFSVGIKNLTDSRYEIWRGYQEFPLTMYVSLQVKW